MSRHSNIVVVKFYIALGLSRAPKYSCPLTSTLTTIINFTILGLV